MRKTLIATTAAALIGGSALAYTAYAEHRGEDHGRWRASTEDMTAFADAHIAALKAGLALNAEQEELWQPVESVMRELARKRIERRQQFRAERRDRDRANPIERLHRRADVLTERGEDLKRLAEASQPLYDSLDEAQRQRLHIMMHHGRRGMHAMYGMRGMHGMHRGGREFGYSGDEGRHMGPHRGPRGRGGERGMGPRERMERDGEDDAPFGSERL